MFLLKLLHANFSIHQWILSATITSVVFAWLWICNLLILSFHLIEILPSGKAVLPPSFNHLFVYSIIYLYQSGLMDIYFILWVKILYYHYLFCDSNCPWFGLLQFLWVGFCVLWTKTHLFLEHFLIFCHYKLFQVHPLYFPPHLWNQQLLQSSLIPSIGKWVFRDQDLSSRCAHC